MITEMILSYTVQPEEGSAVDFALTIIDICDRICKNVHSLHIQFFDFEGS